jgi:hypothetical protein
MLHLGHTGRFLRSSEREYLPRAPVVAPKPLEQMDRGDKTALPYHRGRRIEERFSRYSARVHNLSGSLQALQTDLVPVAAPSDM